MNRYDKKRGTFSRISGYQEYNGFEVLQHMWNDEIINIAPWAKLYRASLWESFRFAECYCEDSATMYKFYKNGMKIGYTEKPLVNYVLRESSDVRSFSEKKLYMLSIYDDVVAYAENNLPEYLQNAAKSKQAAVCFHVFFQMPLNAFPKEKQRIRFTIFYMSINNAPCQWAKEIQNCVNELQHEGKIHRNPFTYSLDYDVTNTSHSLIEVYRQLGVK